METDLLTSQIKECQVPTYQLAFRHTRASSPALGPCTMAFRRRSSAFENWSRMPQTQSQWPWSCSFYPLSKYCPALHRGGQFLWSARSQKLLWFTWRTFGKLALWLICWYIIISRIDAEKCPEYNPWRCKFVSKFLSNHASLWYVGDQSSSAPLSRVAPLFFSWNRSALTFGRFWWRTSSCWFCGSTHARWHMHLGRWACLFDSCPWCQWSRLSGFWDCLCSMINFGDNLDGLLWFDCDQRFGIGCQIWCLSWSRCSRCLSCVGKTTCWKRSVPVA